MDHAEQLAVGSLRLVRRMEPQKDSTHDRGDDAWRDRLTELARRAHQPRERLAVDVLHDEEEPLVSLDDVDHRHDVRVTNARDDPRLVHEHRDELLILQVVRVEPLDGDRPTEALRAEQATEMDRGHAARGELVEERVPTDHQRCGRGRGGCSGLRHDNKSVSESRGTSQRRLVPPTEDTSYATRTPRAHAARRQNDDARRSPTFGLRSARLGSA